MQIQNQFKIFNAYPNLVAAVSQKKDGSMNLPLYISDDKKVTENREKFFNSIGLSEAHVDKAQLIHSNRVAVSSVSGEIFPGTDGLVTNKPMVALSVTVADCLPIFIYDPEHKTIALLHCGWKGLASEIILAAISTLKNEFKSDPAKLLAAIGPGIDACHYEFSAETLSQFKSDASAFLESRESKTYLKTKELAKSQLVSAGLLPENIEVSQECTFEFPEKYFSWRRDHPQPLQAMVAVMYLKN